MAVVFQLHCENDRAVRELCLVEPYLATARLGFGWADLLAQAVRFRIWAMIMATFAALFVCQGIVRRSS